MTYSSFFLSISLAFVWGCRALCVFDVVAARVWCCLMGHTQARSVFPTAFGSLSASGFPSAYSSPIHVVFFDRVFHSARVGITWNSQSRRVCPPKPWKFVCISLVFNISHALRFTYEFPLISFSVSSITRSYKAGGSSRRVSLRAESVREQGLCKRERRQDSVGRRLTAFDGLCVVIKTTADF